MAAGDVTLVAAFIAGVSGSVHCLSMCGGLTGAFGMRTRAHGGSARSAFFQVSAYQLGRIASYMLAGALCGAFGGLLLRVINLASVTLWLRVAAGLLLVMLGLQLLLGWRLLRPIETAGAHVWRLIAPLATRLPSTNLPQALIMGALWGWLPCGLVYSMLMLGVLGGSPGRGALVMLAFGIGTLPSMMSSSLMASQVAQAASRQGLRALAGALMILFGIWTAGVALQHHGH